MSFGYKHGLPIDVDLVFDCRFLPNPHWVDELRPLTGLDPAVRDYVLEPPEHRRRSSTQLDSLLALTLPGYESEGKAYLSIGVGCTGGRHRSVVVPSNSATGCARTATGSPCITETSTATPDVRAEHRGVGRRARLGRGVARHPRVRGGDHRGRERRRRRRQLGPAPPRSRRPRARRPPPLPRRARGRRRSVARRVRAPVPVGRARRSRARQPDDRRARGDARRPHRRARRGGPPARRGRARPARDASARSR